MVRIFVSRLNGPIYKAPVDRRPYRQFMASMASICGDRIPVVECAPQSTLHGPENDRPKRNPASRSGCPGYQAITARRAVRRGRADHFTDRKERARRGQDAPTRPGGTGSRGRGIHPERGRQVGWTADSPCRFYRATISGFESLPGFEPGLRGPSDRITSQHLLSLSGSMLRNVN